MTTDIESQSLETHVALCQQRYLTLERRLSSLENKVDRLTEIIESARTYLLKIAIGSLLSIITALAMTVWAIKL